MTKLATATEEEINQIKKDEMYPIPGQILAEWMVEARLSAKREDRLKAVNEVHVETIRQLRIAAGTAKD